MQINNPKNIFEQNLLAEAFDNSAKAFSVFINKTVTIELINSDFKKNAFDYSDNPQYILVSELRGDLKGKCFLNFTPNNAEKLFSHCLPEKYKNETQMQEAILLELDNILTAAVVTVFSNKLKLNTYADVPQLLKIEETAFKQYLESEINNNNFFYYFYALYHIDQTSFKSDFIWTINSNNQHQ